MSKVSCEVIKDLLPSYLEEICSKDTKEFVDCHLKECEACRLLIGRMERTRLVSEKAEKQVINSIKKVKRHIQKLIGFGILLGLIGIGMGVLLERFGIVPILFYEIVMPIFLIAYYNLLSDYSLEQKWRKWNIGIGIVEVILVGYSVLLEFLCIWWIQNQIMPFGLEESKIGLFLSYQYWISTIVQGILFAVGIGTSVKKGISCRGGINGAVLGICINVTFLSLLKSMDTVEGFIKNRNQTLFSICIEWILVVGILEIVYWFRKKKML